MHAHGSTLLTAVDFVRLVAAVSAAVAGPAVVDALAITAQELVGLAAWRRRRGRPCGAALGPLIGAVGAVGVAVARPERGHAGAVVAAEGAGEADARRAGGALVRAVLAVVLTVAAEGGGDAVAAGTAELLVYADGGLWGRGGKDGKGRGGGRGNNGLVVVFKCVYCKK